MAPPTPVAVPVEPKSPDDFLNPVWFKVPRLDTFRIGVRGEYEYRTTQLVQLTAAQELKYLQSKPRSKQIRQLRPYYFFSIQDNRPVRQEITLLYDDGEYLLQLLRLVYNAKHQVVSQEVVAAYGADGGQVTEAFGVFESPTQFHLTTTDELVAGEDSVTSESDIDSVVTTYAVTADKFRKLTQQSYKRHKMTPLPH